MSSEWSHLPNAKHIDRILASLKANPEVWATRLHPASGAAWSAAWRLARGLARDAAWFAACRLASGTSRTTARDSISALVAWDHSEKYLNMSSDKLQVWSVLSNDPAAILLLPAVRAFEQLEEMKIIDNC